MDRKEFVSEIRAFLLRTGMSGRRFSVEATGDAGFWSRLWKGGDIRISTIERVQNYMRNYRESDSEKR